MDNKLHQVQQQQQQQQGKQTPWRWREKEMEMQTLQHRLSEREREIGRLKEKLRDLTKKLQQEQHYNSKVIPSRHQLVCFFFSFLPPPPAALNLQIPHRRNR